jgi:ABC-type uncharacterized transport system substrate-binding protein
MAIHIGRREFITLICGSAGAWPLMGRAQQPAMPVIGALHAASRAGTTHLMAAYFEGLKSEGYVEAQNVMVEYRWADGVFDRIPEMMAELVRLQPDVITAFGTATRAAYNARLAGTAGNIPLVFSLGYDPIASGLVTSINRPDNNITGVTSLAVALAAKRAEFLRELVPTASKLAFLINQTIDISQIEVERRDIETAARALGWQLLLVHAGTVAEFDSAFATMVRERVEALIIATDTFFYSEMGRLARDRCGLCQPFGETRRRAHGQSPSPIHQPTRANPHADSAPRRADDVSRPRVRRGRRVDELRIEHLRP